MSYTGSPAADAAYAQTMHRRVLSTWRAVPTLARNLAATRVAQLSPTHLHMRRYDVLLGRWRCVRCGSALTPPLWRTLACWLLRRPAVLRLARRVRAVMGPLDERAVVLPARPSISSEDERNVIEAHLGMIALMKKHPMRWPGEPL